MDSSEVAREGVTGGTRGDAKVRKAAGMEKFKRTCPEIVNKFVVADLGCGVLCN
jgi:hypothetical protein